MRNHSTTTEWTISDLYDRLPEPLRKKMFFLLFGLVDFYADPETWLATVTIADPPAGAIMTDFGRDSEGVRRLGRRARTGIYLTGRSFERLAAELDAQGISPPNPRDSK